MIFIASFSSHSFRKSIITCARARLGAPETECPAQRAAHRPARSDACSRGRLWTAPLLPPGAGGQLMQAHARRAHLWLIVDGQHDLGAAGILQRLRAGSAMVSSALMQGPQDISRRPASNQVQPFRQVLEPLVAGWQCACPCAPGRGRNARTAQCQAGAWPHTARTSIWWIIIGLFAKSTIGLGTVSVSGRSRVPYPPTRIKAFIARLLVLQGGRAGGPVSCKLLVPPLSFALLIVESFQNSTKCPPTPSSKPLVNVLHIFYFLFY